jgi:hypothetical protein
VLKDQYKTNIEVWKNKNKVSRALQHTSAKRIHFCVGLLDAWPEMSG